MPLPTIADTVRCSVEGTMPNGRHWANIIHYRKTSALSFNGAAAIADPLIFALWNTALVTSGSLKQYMNTGWSMARIRHTPLDGVSGTIIYPHTIAGLQAGDALPANLALAVTMYTGNRGRRYRGRFYLGGFDELFNTVGGVASPTYVAILQNQLNAWYTSFASTGVSLVVASYGHGTNHGSPTTWTPFATDVASLTINNTWDTQRRRNRP